MSASNITLTLPPPPPPGTAYLAAVKPQLTFLMLAVVLGSPQLPIAIMLFFFSTPRSRRHPVFYLNILVCGITISNTILESYVQITSILQPTRIIPEHTYLAQVTMALLGPYIFDSVLLVRLLAFYPPSTTKRSTLLKILAFPIIIKSARLAVLIAYFHEVSVKAKGLGSVLLVGQVTWFRNPYVTSEWIMEVFDNAYLSGFFLYKVRDFYTAGQNGSIFRGNSVMYRVRGLFTIALGNFVFPVILNIIQVVFITTDRNFLTGSYVLISNCYLTPLGVLFATIWTSSKNWESKNTTTSKSASDVTGTIGHFRAKLAARSNNTDNNTYTLDDISTVQNTQTSGKGVWVQQHTLSDGP